MKERLVAYSPYIAVIAYFSSMFLPGIVFQSNDFGLTIHRGFEIIMMGWLGVFVGEYAWFANVFFIVLIFMALRKAYKKGLILSIVAFCLALQSFTFHQEYLDESGARIAYVDHLGIGFYTWLTSFLIFVFYFGYRFKKSRVKV